MASHSRTYRIHHKCLSINHKFEITDDNDHIQYIIRSTPLSLSHKMSLCQASDGKELIEIHQENAHLHLRYDISSLNDNIQHLATVRKIHGQHHFQTTFEIDSIYGVYKVECPSCPFDHQFKLTTGNKTVVNVTKNINSTTQGHIYDIEIHDDDGGDLFLLSLVIVLWCVHKWPHI